MYTNAKSVFAAVLAEIDQAGLWKHERLITSPQAAHITTNGAEVINSLDVEMTFSSVLPDGRLRTVVEWTSPRSKATATYLACGRIEGNGAVFLQGDSWISQPFKAATLDTYWLTLSGDSMKGRYQGTSYDPADPLLKGDAGTAELRLSR